MLDARLSRSIAILYCFVDPANVFLRAAVDGLRTGGRLGPLPRLLFLYACTAAGVGDWAAALTAGDMSLDPSRQD